jgi:release factor glutamine methyltransferase
MTAVTWGELSRRTAARLPAAEVRWLLQEASGEPWPDAGAPAPARGADRLDSMLRRRLAGEPLQYVLGSWGFRRLDLMVDRRVLIPRPETEQVVDAALEELDRVRSDGVDAAFARPCSHSRGGVVVDLGTGSGAIALSIATERPGTEVWATDVSADALEVARANAAGSAVANVRLLQGSWWAALPPVLQKRVRLVVSNPPYIATPEMAELGEDVRSWEPRLALDAGPGGTEAIDAVLLGAPAWLEPAGSAVVEIAPHQAPAARALAQRAGFRTVEVRADLAGRPRILVARMRA